MLALGKKPASPLGKKAIMFNDVFNSAKMPTVPPVFGQQNRIKTWYTYGNDEYGDCVWAAKAHMHMLIPLLGGHLRDYFWTNNVLSDYAACTGFRADQPNTDQGTDMKVAAEYHRKTGVLDSRGHRHRVDAYVNLTPGNLDQIAMSTYLFGAAELGINLTDDNMAQFDRGEPWMITKADPVGGHCVPVVGRDAAGNFLCITWGKVQRMTPNFIRQAMDEGIAYLNNEIINAAGMAPGAYDAATMVQMLAKISPQPVVKSSAEQLAELLQSEQTQTATTYGIMEAVTPAYPSDRQFDSAFRMLRGLLDQSGYGWALSDAKLRLYSNQIAIGVVAAGSQPSTPEEEKTS